MNLSQQLRALSVDGKAKVEQSVFDEIGESLPTYAKMPHMWLKILVTLRTVT